MERFGTVPLLRLVALLVVSRSAFGLRRARSDDPVNFVKQETGRLVPHHFLDGNHLTSIGDHSLSECFERCRGNLHCVGVQHGSADHALCAHRIVHKLEDGDCLKIFRQDFLKKGFKAAPMVPLMERDGTLYVREDCIESSAAVQNNTYWGVPWDWKMPGLNLVNPSGYGVSPMLDLVTPSVLADLIGMARAPWITRPGIVDVSCGGKDDMDRVIGALENGTRRKDGRALIVDIGGCICPILNRGWDPAKKLRADAVLLLHRDENFSPATRFLDIAISMKIYTGSDKIACISEGSGSIFKDNVEAFEALASNSHVLGMYFTQTPPISHEKVFLMPLGVDLDRWLPHMRPHLQPDSPIRKRARTALYDISHNLVLPYRRKVFNTVQGNFGNEQLRVRWVPYGIGSRLKDIAEESLQSVFGQSPPGIGENCYRHMELLLAGSIPVVQASLGVAAFRYLPHVPVSDWHEVTPDLLRTSMKAIWKRVQKGEFSYEPLTNGFWLRHIQDTAERRQATGLYAKFPNPPVTCDNWNCTLNPGAAPKEAGGVSSFRPMFEGTEDEWLVVMEGRRGEA